MLVLGAALLSAGSLRAEVVATSGAVVQIAPPASVALNALESDTEIRVFDEQQAVVLGGGVSVDISAPGLYDDPADLTPATIPAGAVVDSHLLHFDIVFTGVPFTSTGTVQFADRILGVIVSDALVDLSDGLGAAGTTYPPAGIVFRGAELFETDTLEVGCDTITLSLEAFETFDHIRVITAHEEPCGPHGEGCTPGFWKQCDSSNKRLADRRLAQWAAAGVDPDTTLNAAFGTTFFRPIGLCDAADLNGGGLSKLARHGVAALLNASHPDVEFPLTPEEVIALVQSGNAGPLVQANELGCPLR
jgi:hypothetical protein